MIHMSRNTPMELYNNVFINENDTVTLDFKQSDTVYFERNIAVGNDIIFRADPCGITMNTLKDNVLYSPLGQNHVLFKTYEPNGSTIVDTDYLYNMGFGNNAYENPCFVDISNNDYTFLAGSPAPTLGIDPIDPTLAQRDECTECGYEQPECGDADWTDIYIDVEFHLPLDDEYVDETTVYDRVEPAENGSKIGTTLSNPAGIIGEALEFYSDNSYVEFDYTEFGNAFDPYTSSMTVSLWFKRPSVINDWDQILAKGNTAKNAPGWNIAIGYGRIAFRGQQQGGAEANIFGVCKDLPDVTQWNHIVIVLDRNQEKVIGYHNGSVAGWFAGGEAGVVTDMLIPGSSIYSASPLTMGWLTSGWPCSYAGLIDDVVIWHRALNAEEIQEIYNRGLAHKPGLPICGKWGYYGWDVNHDCYVDFSDFICVQNLADLVEYAEDWLQCTFPDEDNCLNLR